MYYNLKLKVKKISVYKLNFTYQRTLVKLKTGTEWTTYSLFNMKELKTRKYQIKLTSHEHELLKKKSSELGITISNYLRMTSINLLKIENNENNKINRLTTSTT